MRAGPFTVRLNGTLQAETHNPPRGPAVGQKRTDEDIRIEENPHQSMIAYVLSLVIIYMVKSHGSGRSRRREAALDTAGREAAPRGYSLIAAPLDVSTS